jgi:hypothetical protein
MKYRLYTISNDSKSSDIAIPEDRVADFDTFLSNLPEGQQIEDHLNNFGAVLIG